MRKPLMMAAAAACLPLLLGACGSESEAPVEAAPEAPDGISVSDGRMNLPAILGNPAAVYFAITNGSEAPAILRAAYVDAAEEAMLHASVEVDGVMRMEHQESIAIAPGETVNFAPGGLHVMAMDLDPALEPGGTVEVTLTFESGDKVSFPVQIRAPGDAS